MAVRVIKFMLWYCMTAALVVGQFVSVKAISGCAAVQQNDCVVCNSAWSGMSLPLVEIFLWRLQLVTLLPWCKGLLSYPLFKTSECYQLTSTAGTSL
jgi:hypothetical protein